MNHEEKFSLAESRGEGGSFVRSDESHPVGIFLGLDGGCRAVMIVCPTRPPDPPMLSAIRLEVRPRNDGAWALVLRLLRPDLKQLFTRLVEDLETATRRFPDRPGEAALARISRWQRLLSKGIDGLLEDQEVRGLAAELEFLLEEAIGADGVQGATRAWVGPYDAPRDFTFGRVEVEVKAVRRLARTVKISSLEQLTLGDLPVFLWVREVDLSAGEVGDPRSLVALVNRVRAAVAEDAVAAEALEVGLRLAGYEDRDEYGSVVLSFGTTRVFRVEGKFPRIQRTDVASGVVACTYEIAIMDLDPFRVESWLRITNNA